MDFVNIEELKKDFYDADVNEALYYSAKFHYYDGINISISNGADIHYEHDLILYASLSDNDYEMSKYLIVLGADIHTNNEEFLSFSINVKNYNKCVKLIDLGANLNNVTVDKKDFLNYLRKIKLNKLL